MRKITSIFLALMFVFSLAACTADTGEELSDDVEPVGNVEPAGDIEGEPEDVVSDWYDFSEILTVTYYGATDTGKDVAFVMTEDETFAALVVADIEAMETASFVGEMTFDMVSGTYTIVDEGSGLTLTFMAEFSEDSVSLDLGDLGIAVVTACEQSEAFDLLNDAEVATFAVD